MLQGCITKLVTVPVKVAYGVTKGAVKGTAAVVGAVIPDGDDAGRAAHGGGELPLPDHLLIQRILLLRL